MTPHSTSAVEARKQDVSYVNAVLDWAHEAADTNEDREWIATSKDVFARILADLKRAPAGEQGWTEAHGEARAALRSVVVYQVEEDDGRVHLGIEGQLIASVRANTAKGVALMRFDAGQRAALASLNVASLTAPAVGPSREAIIAALESAIVDWGGYEEGIDTGRAADAILALLPQAQDESIFRAQSFTGLAGWKPIKTAPKDRLFDVWREVEGRIPDCEFDPGGYVVRKHSWPVVTTILRPQPSHWMERPAPPGSDEPSATTHETARLSNPSAELIAELCEALEVVKKQVRHDDSCFVSPCTCGAEKSVSKARTALSKAQVAAR